MLTVPQPPARSSRDAPTAVAGAPPSPLLRLYRRLLPLRVRRAVRRRFAADEWERLRLSCERPAALVRGALHRWRSGRLRRSGALADGRRRAVLVRHRTRIAVVRADPTPLRAREWNLRLVCEALRQAGVDHFAVRGGTESGSVIGISAADRPAAETALRAMCVREGAYLTPAATPSNRRAVHGASRAAWRRAARQSVLRLFCYQTDPAGALVLGPAFGCDVEMWEPADGHLVAPRPNPACDRIPHPAPAVEVPGHRFTRLASADTPAPLRRVRSRREFADPLPEDVRFPVDAVYTWVDGDDPAWRRRRAAVAGEPYHPEAANAARYRSRDELRHSLRSLHLHAPWIRHVYLVTDRQTPPWLAHDHPRITVVDHREIFTDPSVLPTFNSHAIESQIHHIDGLAEHFLYFNDDVFLGAPITPQHFFHAGGLTKFFLSKALLPPGPAREDDLPVSAAGKNNRRLLAARFGSTLTQKMKHTPCALRRSVLYEIEREFADAHRRTAASALRSPDDLSIPTSLYPYYAFQTGRAVPGTLRYDYVDVSRPGLAPRLNRLLASRSTHTFCLNDTVSGTDEGEAERDRLVGEFLRSYFPVPGPFELPARGPAGHRVPCRTPATAPRTRAPLADTPVTAATAATAPGGTPGAAPVAPPASAAARDALQLESR